MFACVCSCLEASGAEVERHVPGYRVGSAKEGSGLFDRRLFTSPGVDEYGRFLADQ